MNFKDASALWLEISSTCSFKKPKKAGLFEAILIPSSALYDASAEGCKLRFDTPILDESTRKCIRSIVEKHKLKRTESKESLLIYESR